LNGSMRVHGECLTWKKKVDKFSIQMKNTICIEPQIFP
jgi:hypothetical protein